jgi:hypothetical protein
MLVLSAVDLCLVMPGLYHLLTATSVRYGERSLWLSLVSLHLCGEVNIHVRYSLALVPLEAFVEYALNHTSVP